ncbi:MAG: pseudouridine synthase [Desulfocapsa sp.]|nr:MAG: pseudouridine synthase [Desulfocapsa sp.]
MEQAIRLQKFMAHAGVASRRKCEKIIESRRVQVDGKTVTAMGVKITPGKERVTVDGKDIGAAERHIYILLNKPKGYVTTVADPQGRPIVTSFLQNVKERVFPVGRLDLDTEGALLLTNDGELTQAILHPSNEVYKTYEALVKGVPKSAALQSLEVGIMVENRKTAPAKVVFKEKNQQNSVVQITIHEGRKRQVKKMFQAIGHPVISLKRLAYGDLGLGKLTPGKYRFLTKKELNLIFSNKILYK